MRTPQDPLQGGLSHAEGPCVMSCRCRSRWPGAQFTTMGVILKRFLITYRIIMQAVKVAIIGTVWDVTEAA